MRLAVATLLVLLAAVPAASACERRAGGARYDLRVQELETGVRLAACDRRTGRRRILARAGSPWRTKPTQTIQDFALHGHRVAWITSTTPTANGVRAFLTTLSLRGGPRRRVQIAHTTTLDPPPLGVAFTASGTVAYSRWDGSGPQRTGRELVVDGRVIARGGIGDLEREDRWTLRWTDRGRPIPEYVDVSRPPLRDGCPQRERFRGGRWYGDVLVTGARYPGSVVVTRVCRRGSGRDAVLTASGDFETYGNGVGMRVVGGGDGLLTYETTQFSRYDGCVSTTRTTVEVETLRVVATARRDGC